MKTNRQDEPDAREDRLREHGDGDDGDRRNVKFYVRVMRQFVLVGRRMQCLLVWNQRTPDKVLYPVRFALCRTVVLKQSQQIFYFGVFNVFN